MIERTIQKRDLHQADSAREELNYWLGKSPEERVAAVDELRSHFYGSTGRFKELLALFNANHVEYMIVGGYALAFHGAPRLTGDLALFVNPTKDNAERVVAALEALGFGSLGLSTKDFDHPDHVVQLGVSPVRIDLVMSITGVSWIEAHTEMMTARYGGVPVSYIGRRQFLSNKRATGRKKDLADIEALGEE